MYERILVPTDGSEGTRNAVAHAIDLATTYDAALHTLFVIETNVGVDTTTVDLMGMLEETGQHALDEVIQQADAAGIDEIEGTIGQGPPHRAIVDYVDEHDIDVIVMGTHGRSGLDRYLIGSVTEKVVRTAQVPVMTVPMTEDAAPEDS